MICRQVCAVTKIGKHADIHMDPRSQCLMIQSQADPSGLMNNSECQQRQVSTEVSVSEPGLDMTDMICELFFLQEIVGYISLKCQQVESLSCSNIIWEHKNIKNGLNASQEMPEMSPHTAQGVIYIWAQSLDYLQWKDPEPDLNIHWNLR